MAQMCLPPLTSERINDLRGIAQEYYGTDDLRFFTKGSKIIKLNEIRKINENSLKEDYPFYKGKEKK